MAPGTNANAPEVAEESKGELQTSIDTLSNVNDRLQTLVARMRGVNGRMFDDEGHEENKEPRPVRSGRVGLMEDTLENAHSLANQLEHEIDRIERL